MAALLFTPAACARGPAGPAALDTQTETCSSCRMRLSDAHLAAQIAAPGEEPKFFDDVRCLRDYLAAGNPLPAGAFAYVTDHRTGAWVPASRAVYVLLPDLETPMSSHWAAYADRQSVDADPKARGAVFVPAADIFGSSRIPQG
jgi:copper chaperone NosL